MSNIHHLSQSELMMKASLALLCLALACTAYAADINVSDLHQQLQAVDPRCVARGKESSSLVVSKTPSASGVLCSHKEPLKAITPMCRQCTQARQRMDRRGLAVTVLTASYCLCCAAAWLPSAAARLPQCPWTRVITTRMTTTSTR